MLRKSIVLCLCFVFLFTASFSTSIQVVSQVQGQELPKAVRDKVDAAVEAEMKAQDLVGVSIGVIQKGKVVYTQGYGLAEREKKIPFTPQTVTNWASNSKPVVGVRAMQLVEAGRLNLDDPIRKYIPELPVFCDPITVRHLLCHQSGYPHYLNGRILKLAKPIKSKGGARDPVYSINRFGGSPLLREPGVGFSYSSYAFVILSGLLQRAGGKPLPEQIEEGITRKLKMESFGLDEKYTGQKNWSVGYKKNRFGKVERVLNYAHDWKHGAGAYKSNIIDFARWAEALINGELVSKESQKTMWTPQKLANGKPTNVGLGFFVETQNNTLKVSHGGSHSEARSRMVMYPEQQHGIVVLSNCGHAVPSKISTAIYQALR